jgi:hypothetical protein
MLNSRGLIAEEGVWRDVEVVGVGDVLPCVEGNFGEGACVGQCRSAWQWPGTPAQPSPLFGSPETSAI